MTKISVFMLVGLFNVMRSLAFAFAWVNTYRLQLKTTPSIYPKWRPVKVSKNSHICNPMNKFSPSLPCEKMATPKCVRFRFFSSEWISGTFCDFSYLEITNVINDFCVMLKLDKLANIRHLQLVTYFLPRLLFYLNMSNKGQFTPGTNTINPIWP